MSGNQSENMKKKKHLNYTLISWKFFTYAQANNTCSVDYAPVTRRGNCVILYELNKTDSTADE